jgi:hypothetical protein
MGFVLTALFVVLTIEQYYNSETRFPFIAAVGAGTLSLIFFSPENMLLASIILGTLILMIREKSMQRIQKTQAIQRMQRTQRDPQTKQETRAINASVQPAEDKTRGKN